MVAGSKHRPPKLARNLSERSGAKTLELTRSPWMETSVHAKCVLPTPDTHCFPVLPAQNTHAKRRPFCLNPTSSADGELERWLPARRGTTLSRITTDRFGLTTTL